MEQVEIDRMTAAFMQMLYESSGRDNHVYTGLWEEYKVRAAELMRRTWWEQEKLRQAGDPVDGEPGVEEISDA